MAQSVSEGAIDAVGNPAKRKKLSEVRVARELKIDAGFRCDYGLVRRMSQQNAGASGVDRDFREDRTEMLGMCSVMIGHADDLQTFQIDFFILQIADSNLSDCIQVVRFVPEKLV